MNYNYKICNLYSGSGGNCTYICAGGANILIDAGKSAKSLCRALSEIGVSPDSIDAIFITHEHTDHVSALQTFSHKYQAEIHMLLSSAKKRFYGLRDETLFSKMVFHENPDFEVSIKGLKIKAFPTPHDSCGSVGYKLSFTDGDREISIGFATDIGYVTNKIRDSLLGCESVIIESNHDENMLMEGNYPYELKLRIHSKHGHLSNTECASFAALLSVNGTKNIMLAHLSEENNLPDMAYNETLCAIADMRIKLTVACPKSPVWLVGGNDGND